MDQIKLKLLSELIDYMTQKVGRGLKDLMDREKPPEMAAPLIDESGIDPEIEDEDQDEGDDSKPKGLAIEKVSVMGKPEMAIPGGKESMREEDGDEPTEDELEELLNKLKG